MKKLCIVLGLVFCAIFALGAIGIAFVRVRGTELDKESKAYADAAIPGMINAWNEKKLQWQILRFVFNSPALTSH